jgi:hypothetical protein
MFDLKQPCVTCPFRKGMGQRFRLPPGRLREIRDGTAFQCHKTVDYSGEEPDHGDRPQQCAGLMAVLHREGLDNQIMQIAQRFGELDPTKLDPKGEVYENWQDVLMAHAGNEP